MDSEAIALVNPVDGNPSIRYPFSMLIGLVSVILIRGKIPITIVFFVRIIVFRLYFWLSLASSAEYKKGSMVVASA